MAKFNILVIDDDDLLCASLKKVLIKCGYEADYCMDGNDALNKTREFKPDAILLDIYLSSQNGLDVLKQLQKEFFYIPVVMITGYSDVNIAVEAMKLGAFDFLLKPIDMERLQLVLNRCFDNLKLKYEVQKLKSIYNEAEITNEYFGRSKPIIRIVNSIEKLAASEDTTILLEGESGTGKEVFARFIHQKSPRRSAPFITINCGAIPKDLAESEFFGHEKGAFTGAAQKTKLGKFELADGGTILLDEIGELTLDLQVKLLRALQEKKFYRLGGEKEIAVNVRIIAATNKNLENEVKSGSFREDLYYRLNVAKTVIPPLRDRKEDISILAMSFVEEFSAKFNKNIKRITEDAIELLENYNWKGNIRELKNAIERAILMLEGDELKPAHFGFLKTSSKSNASDADKFVLEIPAKGIAIDVVLKTLILKTLNITGGNQVKAAKILGLSRSKLRYRMEQLGIEVSKKIE